MKNYIIVFFVAILLAACGKKEDPKALPLGLAEELKDAYAKKSNEAKETFDKETGWPSSQDCDGTLWSGLAASSLGSFVKLGQTEYETGRIGRRPKTQPSCYPNESKSTTSRDMVLGFLFGTFRSKDHQMFSRFHEKSRSTNWVIGEPWPERPGEVLLNGNLIGLIGRMACKFDQGCPSYSKIPAINSKSETDYVQHLTALFILLNGEVDEGMIVTTAIPKADKELLKWQSDMHPSDALFNAAYHLYEDGKFDDAAKLLLDPNYAYPSYVRGHENYKLVHWLFTAKLILDRLI